MYTTPRIPRTLAAALSTALATVAVGLTSTPAQAADTSSWEFSATTAIIGHTITAEITWGDIPDGVVCTADAIEPGSDPEGVIFTFGDGDTLHMTSYTPGTYEVSYLRGGCYQSGPLALPTQTVTFTRATWGLSATTAQVGETITTDITFAGHPYDICTEEFIAPASSPDGVVFTQAEWPNWEITASAPGVYELNWLVGGCLKEEPYSLPPVTVEFTAGTETTWTLTPERPKVGDLVTATITWAEVPPGIACLMYYPGFRSFPEGARLVEIVDGQTLTFTADQPGTYTVSFGFDGCHITPDTPITFTEANPFADILERILTLLKALIAALLQSLMAA
jgi:hypothetical protein